MKHSRRHLRRQPAQDASLTAQSLFSGEPPVISRDRTAEDLFRRRLSLIELCAVLILLAGLILSAWNRPTFMDENSFLRNVRYFAMQGTVIPKYANYPSLYSYLISPPIYATYLAFYLAKGYPWHGLKNTFFRKFIFKENLMIWTWVSRLVTMAFAAYLLILVMRRSRREWGPVAGLIAALALLLDPFMLFGELAGYGLPDVVVACLTMAALILAERYVGTGNRRWLAAAAFLAGLAASAKMNGAIALTPVPLALMLRRNEKGRIRLMGLCVLLFGLAFVAGSPALILAPNRYMEGFAVEKRILTQTGHMGSHGIPYLWVFRRLWELDPGLTLLYLAGVIRAAWSRKTMDILIMSLLVMSVLALGGLSKKYLGYFTFTVPLLALLAGRFAAETVKALRHPLWLLSWAFAFGAVFVHPAYAAYHNLTVSLKPDNRILSRNWIQANIPSDKIIAVDWAYLPPLRDAAETARDSDRAGRLPADLAAIVKSRLNRQPSYKLYRLTAADYNQGELSGLPGEYLITSSGCYARFIVSPHKIPRPSEPTYREFMRKRAFYQALLKGATVYGRPVTFAEGGGPTINVFRRVAGGQK